MASSSFRTEEATISLFTPLRPEDAYSRCRLAKRTAKVKPHGTPVGPIKSDVIEYNAR
jgi:hypothetical protein